MNTRKADYIRRMHTKGQDGFWYRRVETAEGRVIEDMRTEVRTEDGADDYWQRVCSSARELSQLAIRHDARWRTVDIADYRSMPDGKLWVRWEPTEDDRRRPPAVPGLTRVEIMLRNGATTRGAIGWFSWYLLGGHQENEIIKYRRLP